ncbi:MAG: hypothetical protein L7F78_02115 [Syntrophales bacterium LBB04]|nr:hypothetical protein [Syntrophales bacterium LBB04]
MTSIRQHTDPLDEEDLLNQLRELAAKLGIEVLHENISLEESSGAGGLCRIQDKYTLFLHSQASIKEKTLVMIKSLRKFDLEDIYVKPAIRKLLEEPANKED